MEKHGDAHATFDAENVQTGEPVTLKLRVELVQTTTPQHQNPENLLTYTRRPDPTVLEHHTSGLMQFQEEWQTYKNGSQSGYTPDYITHGDLTQDDRYEYPGGHLGVLVLSKPRQSDSRDPRNQDIRCTGFCESLRAHVSVLVTSVSSSPDPPRG